MKALATVTTLALAVGCSASTEDPYQQAAVDIQQTVAALGDEQADATVDEVADAHGPRPRFPLP